MLRITCPSTPASYSTLFSFVKRFLQKKIRRMHLHATERRLVLINWILRPSNASKNSGQLHVPQALRVPPPAFICTVSPLSSVIRQALIAFWRFRRRLHTARFQAARSKAIAPYFASVTLPTPVHCSANGRRTAGQHVPGGFRPRRWPCRCTRRAGKTRRLPSTSAATAAPFMPATA